VIVSQWVWGWNLARGNVNDGFGKLIRIAWTLAFDDSQGLSLEVGHTPH